MTWQMCRQRAQITLRRAGTLLPGLLGCLRRLTRRALGRLLLEITDGQQQLVRRELLRAAAEPVPQQAQNERLQLLVLGRQLIQLRIALRDSANGVAQHLLQSRAVLGKGIEINQHTSIMAECIAQPASRSSAASPSSSRQFRPTAGNRGAPLAAFHQRGQLRRCQ